MLPPPPTPEPEPVAAPTPVAEPVDTAVAKPKAKPKPKPKTLPDPEAVEPPAARVRIDAGQLATEFSDRWRNRRGPYVRYPQYPPFLAQENRNLRVGRCW